MAAATSSDDLETGSVYREVQQIKWEHLRQRLRELKGRTLRRSIYKVPNKLRKVDEEAYSPRIVSIGPFHSSHTTTRSVPAQTSVKKDDHAETSVDKDHLPVKEDDKWQHMLSLLQQTRVKKHNHLLAMEENKWWYVYYLLNRTKEPKSELEQMELKSKSKKKEPKSNLKQKEPKPKLKRKEILVQCGQSILELDMEVRGRYAEQLEFEPVELAEIMLVDACFILELFLVSWFKKSMPEDPIFQNAWMVPTLRHDLALLENQIPFFILEDLYDNVVRHFPKHLPCSITDLALSFFYPDLNLNPEAIRNNCYQGESPLHLLDLLHNIYLPISPQTNPEVKEAPRFRKCATELLEAGIEFNKGKEEYHHLLDISFSTAKGDIIIPPLRINETTKTLLRNLIAYEQCCGNVKQHITSYAILLQSLIHSSRDVELLRKKQIIKTDASEVEDVLTFFKNISGGVVSNDFYFGKLSDEVNIYQQEGWHWHRITAFLMVRCRRYLVELRSKYFSSPWTFISFIAAVVLLGLTIVQTIYAVRS